MGRGPAFAQNLELILRDKGISEKDIGWILSKLDSQEYILDECQYMSLILCEESENHSKEIFINRYFTVGMKGVSTTDKINDIFHECIDKKKIWSILEKNFGAICIMLPDSCVNEKKYLFVFGPNKKCPVITQMDSLLFFSPNQIIEKKRQNPLERSSLRLA
tara:strand:- start:32 stop:517 length:486 start_codon:yes stop_codon:yes gene_type:complete